jgi:hypothetical protein
MKLGDELFDLGDVPGTPMLEVVKRRKHLVKGEYASKRDFESVLIGTRAYSK